MNAPLSIREIASIGFPVGYARGGMLMLKLYLDDSGTHDGSEVVGVGGLIGTEAQWEKFHEGWQAALNEPCEGREPVKSWSTHDCRWGYGEFETFKEAERDRAFYRFRAAITASGVFSASNMIDGAAWNEIMVPCFGDNVATAEATALFALIDRLRPWVSAHSEGPQVAVYYDAGRANKPEVHRLAELMQDTMTSIPEIASFGFLRVGEATPLQGADMIATESFWYARDFLRGETEPQRAHFRAYLRDNFHRGNGMILDRAGIERDAARRNPDGTLKAIDPAFWAWRAKF